MTRHYLYRTRARGRADNTTPTWPRRRDQLFTPLRSNGCPDSSTALTPGTAAGRHVVSLPSSPVVPSWLVVPSVVAASSPGAGSSVTRSGRCAVGGERSEGAGGGKGRAASLSPRPCACHRPVFHVDASTRSQPAPSPALSDPCFNAYTRGRPQGGNGRQMA